MSHEKQNLRKLESKIQNWVNQRFISDEQATQILAFERSLKASSNRDWGNIIASTIGALLIGGGIILIFAYNWEDFSKLTKVIISFLPLLIAQTFYGFTFFRRSQSVVWVESSSAFLALALIACISLISQTYHISGTMTDFVLLLMILGIPILFLLPNATTIALYMIGSTYWSLWDNAWSESFCWAFLALVLLAMWRFSRLVDSRLRKIILSWLLALSFPLVWLGAHFDATPFYFVIGISSCIGLYYLIEFLDYEEKPFRFLAVVGVLIMSISLTFYYKWPEQLVLLPFQSTDMFIWDHVVLTLVLIVLWGAYAWFFFQKRDVLQGSSLAIAAFPIIVLLLFPFGKLDFGALIFLSMNLYLIFLGILYIREGMEEVEIRPINLGLSILLILAGIRFVDSNWSLLLKGMAFLVLGILAFLVRWQLKKKISQSVEGE